jgi:uncharacterized membrane-anchored protein YitT (DUF2179 family)
MNEFWKKLIIRNVLQPNNPSHPPNQPFSEEDLQKGKKELWVLIRRVIRDVLLITLGVFSAAFGFKGFLLTNHFIDGGVAGVSLLISAVTKAPLFVLLILLNAPFVLMGYFILGKHFAFKTALAILGLSACVGLVDFPNITDDNLLVAIFGGAFLGAGIGFAVRGGAVIDGTEVLAIFLSRKLGTTIGDIIMGINVFIFSAAAYLLSIEIALYSMITYLSASKTLDFIVEGIEEYIGVTIISPQSEEIRQMIINQMGRGVTIYSGKGGYGKRGETKDVDILYTVITRLELHKLNAELERIDSNAFIVMNRVKDTKGGVIKKRPLH